MDKAGKEIELGSLYEACKASPMALCLDYRGLNVAQVTNLRKDLRAVGARAKVVKNTLAKISAEKALGEGAQAAELQQFLGLFKGPSCLIFSGEDVVGSAKIITKAQKDYEALQIKGGWFDGTFLDEKGVVAVSTMPSREEVLGKLLNLINTPATQLVRLLNAPATQLVQVLSAYKDKL